MRSLWSFWRSIWHFHSILAGILVLEYALTFAIMTGATGVLMTRVRAISKNSGVNEAGLYVLDGRSLGRPIHRSDLFDAMKRFQSAADAHMVALGSTVPYFGRGGTSAPISTMQSALTASVQAQIYLGDVNFAKVLGLRLLHGRWFQANEVTMHYGDSTHVVILSQSLARRLFHDENAIGKQVRIKGHAATVIGLVAPFAAPDYLGDQRTTYTLLMPKVPSTSAVIVFRHTGTNAKIDRVLAQLNKRDTGSIEWTLLQYAQIRAKYFHSDRMTIYAFSGVVCLVLLTALCGILGLTSYWVSQRRGQIAIRRALGATRRNIFLHFLGETSLLLVPGLVLGAVAYLAFGKVLGNAFVHSGLTSWLLAIGTVLPLALVVVVAAVHRWLRMYPVELLRIT